MWRDAKIVPVTGVVVHDMTRSKGLQKLTQLGSSDTAVMDGEIDSRYNRLAKRTLEAVEITTTENGEAQVRVKTRKKDDDEDSWAMKCYLHLPFP